MKTGPISIILVLACVGFSVVYADAATSMTTLVSETGANEGEIEGEEPCVELHRSVPSEKYTPGEPLRIVTRIEEYCDAEFGSIGFIEEIPKSWSFVGIETVIGDMPVIYPSEGATGALGFAWIAVPEFPVEIQYTIKPAEVSEEPLEICGYSIYYFYNDENRSKTVCTTVEALPVAAEGEGELEGEGETEEGEIAAGCCHVSQVSTQSASSENRHASLIGDGILLMLAFSCLTLSKYAR